MPISDKDLGPPLDIWVMPLIASFDTSWRRI